MEEDVKPEDEDGVDGRGVWVCGWNGRVCGLGAVSASLVFGLVRGTGAFDTVLPSFVLVSNMSFAHHNRGFATSFSATFSLRRETMVGGALTRASAFRVGLGVGGAVIAPGLRACSSRSCDGWVCGLGTVSASLVFGLVRGTGDFATVLPSFVLVSNMSFAYHNRGFATSFNTTSSLRRETMVGGTLTRASAFRVGLGVGGAVIDPGLRSCSSRSCDGWVCGLGPVSASLVFGLVRGSGDFATVLPSFVLVSNMSFAYHNRGFATSFNTASSLRRETMVGGALTRASAFRVGLGVGGTVIDPGLRACSSRSCDGWVCGLGPVSASLVFGLVRGSGDFAAVLPSFVLVSNMSFAHHNRGFATSFSTTSSLRRETMVGGALTRASAFRVGLGVSGPSIVSGSCACPSHLWMSRVLTSSSSLGSSSLFCRATQCM
jgi:hypothetical protein